MEALWIQALMGKPVGCRLWEEEWSSGSEGGQVTASLLTVEIRVWFEFCVVVFFGGWSCNRLSCFFKRRALSVFAFSFGEIIWGVRVPALWRRSFLAVVVYIRSGFIGGESTLFWDFCHCCCFQSAVQGTEPGALDRALLLNYIIFFAVQLGVEAKALWVGKASALCSPLPLD